ncbi:MAG TPA: NADH-quinone oxidoreductase subunit M [Methylomirabilota bacterium]|jgi:NADH-quinone oxidoreductase subunit M|nr:NADH-quinone oxidoreductase subunit M [Methylomirabilota bacterium]
MNTFPFLTALTLLPLIGGFLVIGLGAGQKQLARRLGLGISFLGLAMAVALWCRFDAGSGELQFEEQSGWIPTLGVQYHLGVDGLGLLMVMLSAIVTPMALLASWRIEQRVPIYFGLVLFLEAGLFGTFTALNFFHWFIFWELSLIPAFFLIKLWGGPQRSSAATQFFVYTMAGSVALLLAFLAIFLATNKFDFTELAEMGRNGTLVSALEVKLGWRNLTTVELATAIFVCALLGFAVKVPLVPFHTWLPATYAEAPTGTTMLLTGVMSKMGVYGFLRILLPIFPEQVRWMLKPLLWLAVATIVCSAAAALAQRDLKRLLAYSSINHLGYCLLGIFAVAPTAIGAGAAAEKAAALNGVFLQMFNHGLTAATLFWFVGMLEQRGNGLRGLNDFGGLRKVAPVFCGLMGIALFSSLGLPGLNGFIGEFLIFKGSFPLATWATALSVLGLLFTAIFLLGLLQRVFNGPLNQRWAGLPDLTLAERVLVVPALGLMLVLGLYPQLVLGVINSTVVRMVEQLRF